MAKKKSSKAEVKPTKKSLDDFLTTWSDDEEEDHPKTNGMNGHGPKVNGHNKKPAKISDTDSEEEESDAGEEVSNEGEEESDAGEEESDAGEEESDADEEESDEGEEESDEGEGESDEESDNEKEPKELGASQQKRYLASLKDKDPDFFKFLKENDEELLKFDESSDDEEDENDPLHKPPSSLEVASDDSDFSDGEEEMKGKKKSNLITKSLLESWSEELSTKPSFAIIGEVVQAFRAAVSTIGVQEMDPSAKDKKGNKIPPKVQSNKYLVEGSTSFNGVVRLCLTGMHQALNKVLGIAPDDTTRKATHPQRCKSWSKVNKHLRLYTTDISKLMSSLSTGSVLTALLKHVQNLVPFFAAIPKSSKLLTKVLVNLWSTSNEETVRVLAFMCLIRMTRISMEKRSGDGDIDEDDDQTSLLETVLKQTYMAYVRNTKFTSPSAWPMINFMRRSLAEIFNLNHQVAYRYAFIYIRQLTIHLRNAMMQQKGKDSLETVYNWQFVHCTNLWTQLLTDSHPSETLESLIHPLVQVISGAIRLCYTPKYYPLRFHLCNQLILIAGQTEKFIPILPYYLDVINNYNFGKKSSKLSMKPMDFTCCLKVSKSQLLENGFKDTVMDQVYSGILDYLQTVSHKISFPELVVPLTFQIKSFLKKCHVANYCKKLKQILDKIIDNGKFVMENRKKVTFGVRDLDQIQTWEVCLKNQGTPISKYYQTFRKVKDQEQKKEITQNDNLDDYNFVPKLKKKTKGDKKVEEFKGILGASDDEDTEDDEERFELKEERGKKRKAEESLNEKKKKENGKMLQQEPSPKQSKLQKGKKPKPVEVSSDEDEVDQVQDLDMNELESEDEIEMDDGDESVEDDDESDEGDDESDEDDESDD